MKKTSYRISQEALIDLESISEYTSSEWSHEQADRYYMELIEGIEFLANNQFSGKPVDHIRGGYRHSKIKSHLIYYVISQDGKIQISRILHQSMDIGSWLK